MGFPSSLTTSSDRHRLGDFQLHRVLGRGGMGTVYEAWQISLNRTVALKVLAPHIGESPKAVARFQREAEAAAKLHHTHIIPIFARGEENGVYYYAMELVEGRALSDIIHEGREQQLAETVAVDLAETLPLPGSGRGKPARSGNAADATSSAAGTQTFTLGDTTIGVGSVEHFVAVAKHMASIADALEYAHRQGVIHRDIKPHNLMLGDDGRLRVADFGLARVVEQPGVTMTGEVVGSPLYMPPEQISGRTSKLDARADIYSLGATMYEWLTLKPPYFGETREAVISKILTDEPVPPRAHDPNIPLDLETICLKAIERDPSRRYSSAAAMRDDLTRFTESRPISARRAGIFERGRKLVARHPLGSLAIVAAVVALSLSFALFDQRQELQNKKEEVAAATQEISKVRAEQEDILELMKSLVPIPGGGSTAEPVIEGIVQTGQGLSLGDETGGPEPKNVTTLTGIAKRAMLDLYDDLASHVAHETGGDTDGCAAAMRSAVEKRRTNPADALDLVEMCLNLNAAHPGAIHLRAALLGQAGDYAAMRTAADELIAVTSGDSIGYIWRGMADILLGQAALGLEDFDRAEQLDPDLPWIKTLRGVALLELDRPHDAIAILDQALDSAPEMVVAMLSRASAHRSVFDFPPAVADLTRVLEFEPQNADVLAARGAIYAYVGNFDAAISDFNAAMNIAGKSSSMALQVYVALLQRRLQQQEAAGQAAEQTPQPEADAPAASPSEDAGNTSELSKPGVFDWFSGFDWSGTPQEGDSGSRRSAKPGARRPDPFGG